jgi:hypothetical protein
MELQLGVLSGSAEVGFDLGQLGFGQLTLPAGLSMRNQRRLADGALSFSLVNTSNRDLDPRSRLLSFQLDPLKDKIVEGAESFRLEGSLQAPVLIGQQLDVSIADVNQSALMLRGPSSVREGSLTSPFRIVLEQAALAQGQSMQLSVGIAGMGGASLSGDYQPLTVGDLQLASGLSITESQERANGGLVVEIVNDSSRPIPIGTSLVQFRLQSNADELIEKGEAIEVSLASRSPGIKPSPNQLLTAIVDASQPAVNPPPDGGGEGDGDSGQPPLGKEINGTDGPDVLAGSSLNNAIYGGKGADLLTGGGGSNVFRFNLRDGLSQGDVITDFRPGADAIRLEGVPRNSLAATAFGGKTTLGSANAKSAFQMVDTIDLADRSKSVFLYGRLTGELAYNSNGSDSGLGRTGGVIASLPVLLPFDGRDLELAYVS